MCVRGKTATLTVESSSLSTERGVGERNFRLWG